MAADDTMREQVLQFLRGATEREFEEAVRDYPPASMNLYPPHVDYTPWHLLEHLRISQLDILEYIRNPSYVSPPWPDGYWPEKTAQADEAAWNASLAGFRADRSALAELVSNPQVDLLEPMAHTPGHTVLREVLLVAGHSGYHLGEFGSLRQVMQTWPAGHGR